MTRGRRREHYQWNMDIVGVEGVEAEAELLAAITDFFTRLGITSADVGIKVSSRKVLQAVLRRFDVPDDSFAPVCVVVDKIEKLPREKVVEELAELGVKEAAIDGILDAMAMRSLDQLESLLGADAAAVADLKLLFSHAEAYGYRDWLVFDASVVRGLSYYTGVVFEGFDRAGELRRHLRRRAVRQAARRARRRGSADGGLRLRRRRDHGARQGQGLAAGVAQER